MRKGYQLSKRGAWKGRSVHAEDGIQYYYQAVEIKDVNEVIPVQEKQIGLVGYVCEEGVKRNQGRIGAADGPKVFRSRLSKLAYHHFNIKLLDVGDVSCVNGNLELCQITFADVISKLIKNGIFPIAIGGGHDIAYGHFKGIWNAVNEGEQKKIGIINFDAHFDLRPVTEQPNSGTPFKQILDKFESVGYFAIGIQKASNTRSLFQIAKEKGVEFIMNEDAVSSKIKEVKAQLAPFLAKHNYLYITIDLDGFSSAVAPGVSAPSPFGFQPLFVQEVLTYIFQSGKVISCDIAELNPRFDHDQSTANLAARLFDIIVCEHARFS